MIVPRGTLLILAVITIASNISYAEKDSRSAILLESSKVSSGIFSTKSLTSPPFSCNIYLSLTREINILITYCNSSDWQLTLALKDSPMPNLITTSKDTIIYDPKEEKMYQANIGNKIKFSIGLAEGVHEQNNILSKTKVWTDKRSKLPIKIELSHRLISSPDNSWRKLVLFKDISTNCFPDSKKLIPKSKIPI